MMDELHADAIISKDVILNLLFFEAAVQCFGAPPPRAIKMRLPCSLYKTLNVTAAVALVLTRRKRPGEVQVLLLQTDPVVPLAPPPPNAVELPTKVDARVILDHGKYAPHRQLVIG